MYGVGCVCMVWGVCVCVCVCGVCVCVGGVCVWCGMCVYGVGGLLSVIQFQNIPEDTQLLQLFKLNLQAQRKPANTQRRYDTHASITKEAS